MERQVVIDDPNFGDIYIQEVAAASVLLALDASHRSLVLQFARAANSSWQDLMRQVLAA